MFKELLSVGQDHICNAPLHCIPLKMSTASRGHDRPMRAYMVKWAERWGKGRGSFER